MSSLTTSVPPASSIGSSSSSSSNGTTMIQSNMTGTTSISKSKSTSTTDVTRRMICGGIAGMIAKTVTNPLERIKMLSQTGEYNNSTGRMINTRGNSNLYGTIQQIRNIYTSIIKHEGIIGLWAGNGINLLRVFPNKAIIFSTNDIYKKQFHTWYNNTNNSNSRNAFSHHQQQQQALPPIYSFLAGGFAGMTSTAVTYPLDLARGRIAGKVGTTTTTTIAAPTIATGTAAAAATTTTITSAVTSPKVYNGMIQTIIITIKDEGIRGLYKGVTPTLLGAMPYVGIQFGTVGLLEKYFATPNTSTTTNTSNSKKQQHNPMQKMIFGGIGGIMAGIITYPNDTIRRLLQLQGSRGTTIQYNGYIHCLVTIVSEQGGIQRLYRGWTINMIKMAPNTAITFGTYEFLKHTTAQWSI